MRNRASAILTAAATTIGVAVAATSAPAAAQPAPPAPYPCGITATQAIAGTFGDAGLIGWKADHDGVVACLGGSFYVRDGKDATYGYGVYDNSPTSWTLAGGYLPASVTRFHRAGATVTITNFGDRVGLGGHPYVVVYSRVRVTNPTGRPITLHPDATDGLVPLAKSGDTVAGHSSAVHDYAVAADRFGGTYAWPTDPALARAGGFDLHYAHMKSFWNAQLAKIAMITKLPDKRLIDAYKSGYVYTQIIRDGNRLTTGENGYDEEFSHDVIGILANLFTQGDFSDARALLTRARYVIGSQRQYDDGVWKYAWPWALYLEKTGDVAYVKANFDTNGPLGDKTPSIKNAAHQIAADRTGPGGIMLQTNDIDAGGYWTIDDYSALFGLAAYKYLAQRVGDKAEVTWAATQYNSLLAAVNKTLTATMKRYHLDYLPCSMIEPNTQNRCGNPEDANWGAPFLFGRWAWDGYLFGARTTGPGVSAIDATYRYGFGRLAGKLPADTLGGYSPNFYSTGYNAGYGSWGLAGEKYRSQGIQGYEFMVGKSQSGPYSWWESSGFPNPGSPWQGVHPDTGNGSAPHAWGIANANKVLLDSLVAERSDGSLIVGRGVPASWTGPISVRNFPTQDGRRINIDIRHRGRSVTVRLSGDRRAGPVLVELPGLRGGVVAAGRGAIDRAGVVRVPASASTVTVSTRR